MGSSDEVFLFLLSEDCALRNHYTTRAEGKAPPKAAFSPQAVG